MFSIYLDAEESDPKGGLPVTRYGRISMLDLAGSEDVRDTLSAGRGLREAGSINKSLFILTQVLRRGHTHTPTSPPTPTPSNTKPDPNPETHPRNLNPVACHTHTLPHALSRKDCRP